MAEFLFAANDSAGNRVQGKVTAADMGAAVQQVAGMGYSLQHIELASEPPTTVPTTLPANITTQISSPVMPPAAQQPTVQIQPQAPQTGRSRDLLRADAAQRMKVEADLHRLGMSPDEIRRLVNANAATFEASENSKPALPLTVQPPTSPGSGKSKRPSVASLESFAAQLNSSNAAKNNAAVREVQLNLPEFRESSTAETIQAEVLLRDASMMRRREKFRDAETKVREAIVLVPKDAAALELLGDILQGVGRVDEAMAAYKRATEADAKRTSSERKYGDLLMRQQNWSFADPEAVTPNRWLNSIVSLCLPGVGQVFNQDWAKAGVFFALDLICIYLLFYSPFSSPLKLKHVGGATIATFALTIVTYIAAIMDSNISASRKRAE